MNILHDFRLGRVQHSPSDWENVRPAGRVWVRTVLQMTVRKKSFPKHFALPDGHLEYPHGRIR